MKPSKRILEAASVKISPTITTILARRYITKENRNIYVTELGEVVNHMMKEAFPASA